MAKCCMDQACSMQVSFEVAQPVFSCIQYTVCFLTMSDYMFCMDSVVWDYHEYQSTWDNTLADGYLPCEREMEASLEAPCSLSLAI